MPFYKHCNFLEIPGMQLWVRSETEQEAEQEANAEGQS